MDRKVVVLGAGPAGLWTALTLLERYSDLSVTVIEKNNTPGGIASSFSHEGLIWDMGSHRLHPSASPEVLSSIRKLLGEDLLIRKRNGRIRLEGRFLKYPLKPADMLIHLPPSFTAGVFMDALKSSFSKGIPQEGSFAETLEAGLGTTISRRFYFPYAEKLWGLKPDEIDGEQARRRVSASRLGDMVRKIAGFQLPSRKGGFFYYPRGGFGKIFQRAVERINELGGKVVFDTEIRELLPSGGLVNTSKGMFESDFTFSTLPVTNLIGLLSPSPPEKVTSAANKLRYRSMVLCYIKFPVDRLTPFDAHYFPERQTIFSRISERKNYEDINPAPGITGICAEIPCWKTDDVWQMADKRVIETVQKELERTGIRMPSPLSGFTARIEHAYPSYPLGWKSSFGVIDEWLSKMPGLVSLGRQGIYAHDNTHHAMAMGIEAAGCLEDSCRWNTGKWAKARMLFKKHVVED